MDDTISQRLLDQHGVDTYFTRNRQLAKQGIAKLETRRRGEQKGDA